MTAVVTTHRAENELGPPITAAGLVRWLSASALVKFDANSEGGCPLRGWFHYVGSMLGVSLREPETEAMSAGTATHKEIEEYLNTGRMTLGPVALSGRHFIPEPGPGLCVEQPIIIGGHEQITGVYLRIAGVPYAGHLDLFNHRGEYIDAQGELRRDPPGTLEAKDWKTTSDLKWSKNPEQVANAIPMTGYAMAGFAMWPQYERARLTHVYFSRGKAGSLLSTARRERMQVERRWEYATGVARSIIDIAREVDSDKVPVNTNACWSYGKLCTYYNQCPRGQAARTKITIEGSLGPRLAALVSGNIRAALGQTTGDPDMGMLKNIGKNAAAPAAPDTSVSIDDLLDEETAGRDEAAPGPQPIPPPAGWSEAWQTILASGLGRPALGGDAAIVHNTDAGVALVEGEIVPGEGKLASEKIGVITDPARVIELGAQIRKKLEVDAAKKAAAAKPTTPPPITVKVQRTDPAPAKPIELLAADAPASKPALAADPVEGLDNAKTRELAAARGVPAPVAPQPVLTAEQKASPQVVITAPVTVQADLTTRTAIAVGADGEVLPAFGAAVEPPAPAAKRGRPLGSTNKAINALNIYVDVSVDGLELKLLDGYVKIASDALCKAWDCKDVRLAGNQTEGGYSRGPTVLTATCLANPPPAGSYFVDTRSNPLVEAVAVALRQTCLDTGGVFVRGIR